MQPDHVRYVVPYGPTDASVRERVHAWRSHLERSNMTPSIGVGRPLTADSDTTVTVVLRHTNRFAQGLSEARLLRQATFGIYELDDGLPVDNGRLPGLGKWWKPLFAKSRIANRAGIAADRIIAGNELLADWASTVCQDVKVVPTCVEPDVYIRKKSYDIRQTPTILWIGSPATEPHLFMIAPALAEVHRRTGACVVLVSRAGRPVPQAMEPFTTRVEWTPTVHEKLSELGDVGIMPLPNNPYEQYKCAYKLLQYSAAALPIVGSPVGMSSTVLRASGAPAPTTTSDWIEALATLVNGPAADREAIGTSARAVVQRDYSFASVWPEYRAALAL